MSASKTYPVPENILQSTHLTASQYDEMYKQSVEQPEAFWAEHASMLEWYQKPTKIKNTMFGENDVSIKWFEDGELNASYNCIDRHLADNATKVAYHWEGDSPEDSQDITYQQVHYEVCKFYSLDEHTAVPDVLLIGTDTWSRLNDQQKEWVKKAVKVSTTVQRKLWAASEKESIAAVKEAGVQVVYPEKKPFEEQTKGILKLFDGNEEMKSLITSIKNQQ